MPDRTHTETIRFDPATGLYFAWRGSHTVNVRHSPDGDDVDCFSFGYGPGRPELTVDDFHEHVDDWLRENTDEHRGDDGPLCDVCGVDPAIVNDASGERQCADCAPECPECGSLDTFWAVDGRYSGVLNCPACDASLIRASG